MLISHNEIEATCKKVFDGMGFAAGEDEAAAVAVAWLALHGLPILPAFADELDRLAGQVGCVPSLIEETAVNAHFDCGDCCSLITGTPAVGYGFAKAANGESTTIVLHNVCLPDLLLPQLVSFAQRAMSVQLCWADRVAVVNAGELFPTVGKGEGETAVIIRFQKAPFAHPAEVVMKTADFQSAYKKHCHQGIIVDDKLWQKYINLSKAVLVPETEASRLRGAGENAR